MLTWFHRSVIVESRVRVTYRNDDYTGSSLRLNQIGSRTHSRQTKTSKSNGAATEAMLTTTTEELCVA